MSHGSMTATLKYALMSEKKISLVAKMIRGKPVPEVMRFLQFLPKKAAKTLLKLVRSASSNAKNNLHIDEKTLYVKTIEVGKGPSLKRVRPVWRSRMHRYEKHRSFVKVVLDVQDIAPKTPNVVADSVENPEVQQAA